MSWRKILKNTDTPPNMWPEPKLKFESNPDRALGYVMSYWYLQNQKEIEDWVDSQSHLEGIFIDTGNRSQTYRFGVGGYFIFNRTAIQQAIEQNVELLEKYNIPQNVDSLVDAVATKRFNSPDIYDFIGGLFGDERKRSSNPLKLHRREAAHQARQRGFE
jgi:hypothetical protein